jgi:hypothetical protein
LDDLKGDNPNAALQCLRVIAAASPASLDSIHDELIDTLPEFINQTPTDPSMAIDDTDEQPSSVDDDHQDEDDEDDGDQDLASIRLKHNVSKAIKAKVWIALRCVALRCVALRCVALRCVALRCVALRWVMMLC